MAKYLNTEYFLAEIESDIEAKEQQINRLKTDLASLTVGGQETKNQPKLILQQLSTLQDNVHLLKVRRKFFLDIAR